MPTQTDDFTVSVAEAAEITLKHMFTREDEESPYGMLPVCLLGPYGVGKSACARYLVDLSKERYGYEFDGVIDIRPSTMTEVDVRGVPDVIITDINGEEHHTTIFAIPEFLPREGNFIVLIDEFPDAAPTMQSVLYQLILDRRIGEYVLPDGCYVMAAGNTPDYSLCSNELSGPAKDRFTILNVQADKESYLEWARTHNVHPSVMAYVNFNEDVLCSQDIDDFAGGPSPRSISTLGKLVDRLSGRTLEATCQGKLGKRYGMEFYGFLDFWRQIPNMDQILNDPDNADVPNRLEIQWCTMAAIGRQMTKESVPNVMRYLQRFESSNQATFITSCFRDAGARDKKIISQTAFTDWLVKNQDIVF